MTPKEKSIYQGITRTKVDYCLRGNIDIGSGGLGNDSFSIGADKIGDEKRVGHDGSMPVEV